MSHFIFNMFKTCILIVLKKKKTRIYAIPAVKGLGVLPLWLYQVKIESDSIFLGFTGDVVVQRALTHCAESYSYRKRGHITIECAGCHRPQ